MEDYYLDGFSGCGMWGVWTESRWLKIGTGVGQF